MALMRSGQKGFDEIQRIRAAMEGGNPVILEPLQQLIKVQAALLGEDGDAIIQDIQAEAEKDGKLPVDIFKLIESCCMDLGQKSGTPGAVKRDYKGKGTRETSAGGSHTGASNQVQRRPS
jgi:hypothetical protein